MYKQQSIRQVSFYPQGHHFNAVLSMSMSVIWKLWIQNSGALASVLTFYPVASRVSLTLSCYKMFHTCCIQTQIGLTFDKTTRQWSLQFTTRETDEVALGLGWSQFQDDMCGEDMCLSSPLPPFWEVLRYCESLPSVFRHAGYRLLVAG